MTDTVARPRPEPRGTVASPELRTWLTSPDAPRVLDVRTPAEFESAHIPGSYNVPLDTLREHRSELTRHLDPDVVLVCRSGKRAEQAQQALLEAGLGNVHVLAGGIAQWEAGGGALTHGRQRWDLERQVRLAAGSLVLLAGLASLVVPAAVWIAIGVGGGLVAAALTDTCAMGTLLGKLPFNRGAAACDIESVVAELSGPTPRR